MQIEQQKAEEHNPEVQVNMTLSELKTIVALVGASTDANLQSAISYYKNRQSDDVKYVEEIFPLFTHLKDTYNEIPKFQPLTVTIESEEELIAIRIGLGKLSGPMIENCLNGLRISRDSNELDKIYKANYSMFLKFDTIFEGQVK